MDNTEELLLTTIKQCIKDIDVGDITEQEVVDYMKSQGQDWQKLRKGYENMIKIAKVMRGNFNQ